MVDMREIVGTNVKELRELRGWTQEALAERADISRTHLAFIETARRWAAPEVAGRLAHALGVPTPRLYFDAKSFSIEMALSAVNVALGFEAPAAMKG